MLLVTFLTRLLKKQGYSDVVIAFSDVRSRESRCCSPLPPPPIQNAACRHDHRRAKSDGGTSRIHTSAGAITIAVQLASNSTHGQNAMLFSIFAIANGNPKCRVSSQSQTSQISRRQHHALIHASAGAISRSFSIRTETRHHQNPLLFSTFATANPECRVSS